MPKRIAILTMTHFAHGREIVRGLLKYGNEHHPDWHFQVVWRSLTDTDFHARLAAYDVVVNAWADEDFAHIPVPSIRVTSDLKRSPGCVVDIDDVAVGQLAADYLTGKRARSFVSVWRSHLPSSPRIDAFNAAVGRAGFDAVSFRLSEEGMFSNPQLSREAAVARLTELPRPVGLFADTDSVALSVLQLLHKVGLRVPDDVMLLGVDNDQFVCEMTRPAISSIAVPFDRAGYLGGEMIDRFFATGKMPQSPPLLPPIGVASRGSTVRVALGDSIVAEAVRFVQERVAQPLTVRSISVSDVADHLSVSVRTLQSRFRKETGRTLSHEIASCRVARAQELLRDMDLSLKQIARKTGFSSTSKLCDVFKRVTGTTPGQFRRSGL